MTSDNDESHEERQFLKSDVRVEVAWSLTGFVYLAYNDEASSHLQSMERLYEQPLKPAAYGEPCLQWTCLSSHVSGEAFKISLIRQNEGRSEVSQSEEMRHAAL